MMKDPAADEDNRKRKRRRGRRLPKLNPKAGGRDPPPPPPLRRYYAVRRGQNTLTSPPAPLRSALFLRWEDALPYVGGCPLPTQGPVEHASFNTLEEAAAYLKYPGRPARRCYAVRFGYSAATHPPAELRSAIFLRWEDACHFAGGKVALLGAADHTSFDSVGEAVDYIRKDLEEREAIGDGKIHAPPNAYSANIPGARGAIVENSNNDATREMLARRFGPGDGAGDRVAYDNIVTRDGRIFLPLDFKFPPNWKFPPMSCSELLVNWFMGNKQLGVPPLVLVQRQHVQNVKNGTFTRGKMASFMRVVEREAREKGVWIEKVEDWDYKAVIRMWDAIRDDFNTKYCRTKRRLMVSWTTAYNQMSKEGAFVKRKKRQAAGQAAKDAAQDKRKKGPGVVLAHVKPEDTERRKRRLKEEEERHRAILRAISWKQNYVAGRGDASGGEDEAAAQEDTDRADDAVEGRDTSFTGVEAADQEDIDEADDVAEGRDTSASEEAAEQEDVDDAAEGQDNMSSSEEVEEQEDIDHADDVSEAWEE